ncbi:MAG: hypothetical protein ACP5QZ_09895 [Candidatus Sumerlaeaceae bacterium]|jgi:hypothetical protein
MKVNIAVVKTTTRVPFLDDEGENADVLTLELWLSVIGKWPTNLP